MDSSRYILEYPFIQAEAAAILQALKFSRSMAKMNDLILLDIVSDQHSKATMERKA